MKRLFVLMGILLLTVFNTSCSSIDKNRENVKKLSIGMNKEQVLEIMGEPLKNESYNKPNIWFYQTKQKWMDGVITRDECTPIVFDEANTVIGWGFPFYKKNILFR